MDEPYKNLQPARARKLGYVLLALFAMLMLANNRAIHPVLEHGGPIWHQAFFAVMCGVIVAQFCLLAIWTVLSPQVLWRRLVFLACAGIALSAAWTLGFATSMDPINSVNWAGQQEVYLFGFLPTVFLACSLPLMAWRFFSSFALSPMDHTPVRRSVSIAGLLTATGIVALVFAAMQFPAQLGLPQSQLWLNAGVVSGIAFAVGLFIALPAVLSLFSKRRNYWIWSLVLWLATAGMTAALFAGLRSTRLAPANIIWPFVTILTTAAIFTTLGIGIIRLFGYRLIRIESHKTIPRKK